MPERDFIPSGISSELDGSKSRRDLAPIEIAQWVGLGVAGFACMIEAIHQNTRMPRREILRHLGGGTRMIVSKTYRDQTIHEDRQLRLGQLKDFRQSMSESGYTVPEYVTKEITKLEQKLHVQ